MGHVFSEGEDHARPPSRWGAPRLTVRVGLRLRVRGEPGYVHTVPVLPPTGPGIDFQPVEEQVSYSYLAIVHFRDVCTRARSANYSTISRTRTSFPPFSGGNNRRSSRLCYRSQVSSRALVRR